MDKFIIQVLQEDRWIDLTGGALHSKSNLDITQQFKAYVTSGGATSVVTAIELAKKLAVESLHLKKTKMRVVKMCPITTKKTPCWEQLEVGKSDGHEYS